MERINHILDIPDSLLEAAKKKIAEKEEEDKKDPKKKNPEKIIMNPELNNPNNGPSGHSAPDMAGDSQAGSHKTS